MRKNILFLCAICINVIVFAQGKTEIYLKKTPALPRDSCNISKAEAENFYNQVSELIVEVENDIDALNEQVDQNADNNEAAAKENAMKLMQQYGMSEEDMAKMKNKDLSDEDKEEIANNMMMQQANMSMDEAKKLQNMSEAGQQAYATAYATEMMATQTYDPQQQAKSDDAKNSYQLISEQQVIIGKINANNTKIANLYAEIENDPSGKKMLDNIAKWNSQWTNLIGIDYGQGKQMDSLYALMKNEKIKYCEKFTPKYRNALRQHLSIFKAALPDYRQMADITDQLTKSQTGISTPPESKELMSLQSLKSYLEKLKDVSRYKLYYPEDN